MIGALGACFGRVVTMDSPRARPGEFQWEATLWHELAHVITLQMSNQRLPRWLTEGISEYEENRRAPRPVGPRRRLDVRQPAEPRRDDQAERTERRVPESAADWLGYYQASLVVEHIVDASATRGCASWSRVTRKGMDTKAALKAALNTDFDELQAGFDKAMEERFGALRAALKPPEGDAELLKMPLDALEGAGREEPGQLPGADGARHALRRDGRRRRRAEGVRARRRAGADGDRRRQPARPDRRRSRIETKDLPRAIAELEAVMTVRLRQRRGGPRAGQADARRRRSPTRPACSRSTSGSRRSIRSTAKRTRRSAGWRCSATTAEPRSARSTPSSR